MRLSTKISALTFAGGAVLCILGLSGGAVAQTQQPKGSPRPNSAFSRTGRAVHAAANWVVNCSNSQAGLACRAGQSLFIKKTGQRFLSVAVAIAPDTKKPNLLLQLPLGVYLPAGVSLQIGKDAAKTLPFESCDQGGCVAEYAVTDAELGAMAKGADLTISAQNLQKKSFTLQVPALGFAAAYAKIK